MLWPTIGPEPVCTPFPYSAPPCNSTQSTIRQGEATAVSGSVVAYPVVVFRPGQSVNRAFLGDFPKTRSVNSSSGHDLAPSGGFMEAMGVAP